MLNFFLRNATIIKSIEDENTIYLCVKNKRYIFRDGKYTGWYRP